MTAAQVVVTLAGAALAIGVNVYFFGPASARARRGAPRDGGATVPGAEGGSMVMPGDGHPGENPRPPAA